VQVLADQLQAKGAMEQQPANSALSPPTSSASTGSLGASTGGGAVLASTADSIGVTGENTATVLPHRRRLGKTTA